MTAGPAASGLLDLHTHVLPGIDDGARDDAQALAMLRIAADDGISTLVATPHAHHTRAALIPSAVARLNALAAEAGIAVRVLPGMEVRIGPGLVERLQEGSLLTLAGTSALLLELPLHDEWPPALVLGAVDRLLAAGYRPILAHVERYPFVQRDPRALAPFRERGVALQVNARSFGYREADADRIAAEALLAAGLVDLLASDAHNDGYRPPRLRDALARIAALAGEATATRIARGAGCLLGLAG